MSHSFQKQFCLGFPVYFLRLYKLHDLIFERNRELESETPACVTSIRVICFYGIILCVISVYIVQCFVLPLFTLSCVNSGCIISLISVFVSSFHLCFSCGCKCFCPSVVCVIRVHYAMFCVISVLHYHVIKKK